jgi:hypothetical protein
LGEPTSVVSTIAPDNVYGRLTVICAVDPDVAAYKREWLCRCRCKNYKLVRGDRLAYKKTRSCGCRAVDAAKQQLRLWQKRLDIALDRLKEQEAKQEKLEALLATL